MLGRENPPAASDSSRDVCGPLHTAITELLDTTNGDLRRAQDFAGHADPRTTRRHDRNRNQLDGHGAYLLAGRYDLDD